VAGGHGPAAVALGDSPVTTTDTVTLPRAETSSRQTPSLVVPGLVLTAAALVVAWQPGFVPLTLVAALGVFVALPVTVLHRRADLRADSGTARFGYALGLTTLGLILVPLLLNTVLPLIGIDRPLAPLPLAGSGWLVGLGLLAWRRETPLIGRGELRGTFARAWRAPIESGHLLGVLAVVAAVLGAIRLNNGAGGGLALLAVFLCAAALLVLLLRTESGTGRDARILFLVSAALLLATSLRGWGITGHDIQAEYLAFRLTDGAQHWQMSALPSAYNACMSVTVLPTVLAQTTGLPGTIVFKVLLQLLFALVPVLTYLYGRRLVGRRAAITAAALTVAFPTFFTDMPYLVRQEVAFFFLALVLLAVTEPGRTRWGSRGLVLLLGLGVVLSHYSTTYVLLMAVGAALVAAALAALVRRLRHRPGPEHDPVGAALVNPLVAAVLLGATLVWAGPITDTGGHATDVLEETVAAITGNADTGPGSSDTSYAILSGADTSPRHRMNMFVEDTLDYRADEIPRADQVFPRPGPDELRPRLHDPETAPLTPIGRALDAVGLHPDSLATIAKLGGAILFQVLALLGFVWLLIRLRRRTLSHEVAVLATGSMVALALIVVIPNLSVDYGVLRAFQQTLLVTAPMMAMGLRLALGPLEGRPRAATAIAAGLPVLLLLLLSGALPALAGGQQPRVAMANAGNYYDRFVASDAETAAIRWLFYVDHADQDNTRLIASRNVDVRLLALSDNRAPIADRLYPTLLSRDAYVFVDSQIIREGTSTVFYTGDLLTYTYPLSGLDQRLDLLYSGPDARIYR
jgi:uncharacterized membrane protein